VLLETDGHTVCMTRCRRSLLQKRLRHTYSNTTEAEILVSVHMNGSSNPNTDYTTTLFGKWRKDKEPIHSVFDGRSALPTANGAGIITVRFPTVSSYGLSTRREGGNERRTNSQVGRKATPHEE
jgi:N-acetylmuramoyl-L-alanine amidase